ncbi:hypothetical protein [Methylophaga thalassica]|uniref:hypothetical protein n=1 Tax=Methylophaga aminisulfidivorans TaxID=230105 RepID=UPI003A8DA75C
MKQIIFLALMIMPLLSFAGASDALLALLRTPPSERIQPSSKKLNAIERLKRLGIINSEPDIVTDYNHIYMANKQVPILGGVLLALNDEYLDSYVGCCVNPGIALVLDVGKKNADVLALMEFAKENACSVTPYEQASMANELEESLLDTSHKEEIVVLSCKLHDEANTQIE